MAVGDSQRRREDERIDDLVYQIRALAPIATMVAAHEAKLELAQDDRTELRKWIGDIKRDFRQMLDESEQRQKEATRQVLGDCTRFHLEWKETRKVSATVRVAWIGGGITFVCALIAAGASLIGP